MHIHAEKSKENKIIPSQVAQLKTTNDTVLQLVDNRTNVLSQKRLFQTPNYVTQLVKPTKKKVKKPKYGDSAALGAARFRVGGGKKAKGVDFKIWKKGREAQHLIPAQVCKYYGIPVNLANSAVNGMMLPSGRTTTNNLRMKSLDKGKMHHIKGAGSHPKYNKFTFKLAKQRKWQKGKVTKNQFNSLTMKLRKLNRPKRTGPAKGYIDDLK